MRRSYFNLFNAASYVNSLETKNAMQENNTTASVSFVMSPNTYFPMDSTVVVTPAEIKKYYKAHQNFFEQQASRDIEYVVFEEDCSRLYFCDCAIKFFNDDMLLHFPNLPFDAALRRFNEEICDGIISYVNEFVDEVRSVPKYD